MYCTQCGAQAADDALYCPACGKGMGSSSMPLQRVRPAVITLLSAIKFVSGICWLFLSVPLIVLSGRSPDGPVLLVLGIASSMLGVGALVCGYGLWRLRAYGRYLQIAFSCLGLIGFPLQTVISILVLVYMFNGGVRVLFSATPVENLGALEREQLQSLRTKNTAAIIVAVAVVVPVMIAFLGIIAAIAIPNFLNAVDRGKQKRTMADLRSIGTAVESYAVDNKAYPTATSAAELQSVLEPVYIKKMPVADGWGRVFQVESHTTEYTIFSHGKDGAGSICTPGTTTRFDAEICFVDGQFTRYPPGSQS